MSAPVTLFEVSWEVGNKVGGIHTVVSTKAKTLVETYGDRYVAIGPWLLSGGAQPSSFEEEPGFEAFCESCRALGVPVRVGRWKIPGRPRTLLVEFSGLFAKKDEILAELWEHHRVDSITGEWDYVEPVLFGWAAGAVIEAWHREFVAPERGDAVAQFHEWMTGSGGLRLKRSLPSIGTVFTTHATMLGRSIASTGVSPMSGLSGRTFEEASRAHGVVAKSSIESVCARDFDVFTTVSEITAREAELYFGVRAKPLLPNGIDLGVIDEIAGSTTRAQAERRLRDLAHRFLGEPVGDAALLTISGRYEFHNKGIDLLLDACADLAKRPGRKIVLFVLVPAGNSGVRREVLERLSAPADDAKGPIGISTHNLFDVDRDPVHERCAKLGLDNALGARVKVVQIPVYLGENDGLLDLPYEAVLRAMELSCFPSYYEPWGYTPEESLAVGVPTITSDCAGFGQWALTRELTPASGVTVLAREGVEYGKAVAKLADVIQDFLAAPRDREIVARTCRETAQLTAWSDLVKPYREAFAAAIAAARARATPIAPSMLRPKVQVPIAPQGARPRLFRFSVAATMPEALRGLERLARNLWWSWDPEATQLFRELYPSKWRACRHNPVVFLRDVYPEDLEKKAQDTSYLARLERVMARFDAYLADAPVEVKVQGGALSQEHPVAYFSAEFGLHESLRIYSGGLGILAGDHLKSASDLGLPLIGIGLFYRMGYVKQRLSLSREQVAAEAENDPRDLPLDPVLDEKGQPLEIEIAMPSSTVAVRAWKVAVGRVTLYLLDTNVERNRPEDREITRQLYGGDHENRLRQEIVLGRAGKRLISRLDLQPACYHINEGHAAFLVLERVSRLVRECGLTFEEARDFVRATTAFTTHTPVPAGHDRFAEDLMRRYFSDAPNWVGVPWERFFQLGTVEDDRGSFNMTYLAMHFAAFTNGVSKLHGQVSRKLLQPFFPRLLEGETPVDSITNGVHLPTWTDPGLRALLGVEERAVRGSDFAAKAEEIDERRLWDLKRSCKRRLIEHLRERLEASFVERGDSPLALQKMLDGLDPDALWIGFARRFAPYKRAQLVLRDKERLAKIVARMGRPVRFVFAGKAHPADKLGQEILRAIVELTRSEPFLGKVVFVEDYDVELARQLVAGVDVWLNNPIRPLEASGTSGMKVAANGGLNLSILDGWWVEAFDGRNGWSIGGGRTFPTQELQDESDGDHLYRLIEEEVVPLYFERESGVPRGWVERMKRTLRTIPPVFDTDRMVGEYRDRAYVELASSWFELHADGFTRARARTARTTEIRRKFESVRIVEAHVDELSDVHVRETVEVRVDVDLAGLAPSDVQVELVLGHTKDGTSLDSRAVVELAPKRVLAGGARSFEGSHELERSGSFAYGIRVRPRPLSPRDTSLRDLALWA